MKFRKKPVVIEAMEFTEANVDAIDDWIASHGIDRNDFGWQGNAGTKQTTTLLIKTLEGTMHADVGDWIICGVAGEEGGEGDRGGEPGRGRGIDGADTAA